MADAIAGEVVTVEFTADGYLRLPAEFALAHFPQDRCAGLRQDDGAYVLLPVTPIAPNALIMKQRTLAGERSVLIREIWGDDHPVGSIEGVWSGARRRLVLSSLPADYRSGETVPTAGLEAPALARQKEDKR